MNIILVKNMFYNLLYLFLILINLSFVVYNDEEIQEKESIYDSIVKQLIELEKDGVLERADKFLNAKTLTITSFSCPRSAGGKHDFFSEGPYWWPDPANPNGPFIKKDGLRNPDRFEKHDNELRNLSQIVGTQTSAWLLTGEEKYARSAMRFLKVWFVDTATRMNPNMLYSQAIKGVCTGRGTGIIDAVPLMDVAQSVLILEKSPYVSAKDIMTLKEWFTQFIAWLTTHPYGIKEMNADNNHGMWWHAQIAVYARLVDDQKALQLCRDHFKEILLPNQMAADGSFPLELERTKPYSYSLFNLDAMASLAWTLSDKTFDTWNYSLPDGRGLKKGLGFFKPFIQDKTIWPYGKDISNWNEQPSARQFMLFAALAGNDQKWFDLWKSLVEKNKSNEKQLSNQVRNPLLWIGLAPYEKSPGNSHK